MTNPSANKLTELYVDANLKELAIQLPHAKRVSTGIVKFLLDSSLLKMGDWITKEPITFGADPEFILYKGKRKDNIVLFSSEYTSSYFGLSEADIGADYGLLEFRPPPEDTPTDLILNIRSLYERFESEFHMGGGDSLNILEKEAVEFNHKRERIRHTMEKGEDINYGVDTSYGSVHKDPSAFCAGSNDVVLTGLETNVTLCAYDKPVFGQYNPSLLTAGGHIHIGGALIKMLSFQQLRMFVRKLDSEILPICKSVETRAGSLRRTVYGAPGEFRVKEYGIEYRSPSNAIFFKKNLKVLSSVLEKMKKILTSMAL